MHLQSNHVVIAPDERRTLDLSEVPEAIRRAGFAPADMWVKARGSYEGDGAPRFRIRGWRESLPVEAGPSPPPAGEILVIADVDYARRPVMLRPRPGG